jgi:holo-[acyl-carrier protein] synthase
MYFLIKEYYAINKKKSKDRDMIKGIGVDVIEIVRIKQAILRQKQFKTKVFTPEEIAYCEAKGNPYASYAARFAAKEAILKAFGLGLGKLLWQDLCILNREAGIPTVILKGKALAYARKKNIENIMVSLSHSKDIAIAYVMALEEKE